MRVLAVEDSAGIPDVSARPCRARFWPWRVTSDLVRGVWSAHALLAAADTSPTAKFVHVCMRVLQAH